LNSSIAYFSEKQNRNVILHRQNILHTCDN